jgi:hypothetical protein
MIDALVVASRASQRLYRSDRLANARDVARIAGASPEWSSRSQGLQASETSGFTRLLP